MSPQQYVSPQPSERELEITSQIGTGRMINIDDIDENGPSSEFTPCNQEQNSEEVFHLEMPMIEMRQKRLSNTMFTIDEESPSITMLHCNGTVGETVCLVDAAAQTIQ